MACVHNQAKIDALEDEIEIKEHQIAVLRNNIDMCGQMLQNYGELKRDVYCVLSNLSKNYVVPGKAYDNGIMSEYYDTSKKRINECDKIIKDSNNNVSSLEKEIVKLQSQIESLQGDCSACIAQQSQVG